MSDFLPQVGCFLWVIRFLPSIQRHNWRGEWLFCLKLHHHYCIYSWLDHHHHNYKHCYHTSLFRIIKYTSYTWRYQLLKKKLKNIQYYLLPKQSMFTHKAWGNKLLQHTLKEINFCIGLMDMLTLMHEVCRQIHFHCV